MYYTNSMKITLKNNEVATNALEILRIRLSAGFDCDKNYRRIPTVLMHDNMEVVKNTIVLPDDFGCYLPEDAEKVIPELMKELATHLSGEGFTFDTCNSSDYDEGWVEGNYANGELKVKTTYFPSGYSDFYCEECDEVVISMDDYEEGEVYICPECGEEIDLSEWAPITTEKIFKIF